MKRSSSFSLLLVLSLACAQRESVPTQSATPATVLPPGVHEMTLPPGIGTGGAEPFLSTARDGSLMMSWLEQDEASKNVTLKLARSSNGKWSDPIVVVRREDLFANWADFPSVVEGTDGTLFAHWLQKSGSGTYAYDVMLARSQDRGASWSTAVKLNDDKVQGEHGFVSLVPHPAEGAVSAVWLDGRNMTEGEDHEGHGDMMLRYANIDGDGTVSAATELDPRTCECCTTAMAWSESGPVIAYRDRDAGEIRDISVVRLNGTTWTEPRSLHTDGWKIQGCPVNGPQLDARGRDVAVAWFTAAGDKPQVLVAFSSDSGSSFGKPTRIDAGAPAGRVDVVLLPDGRALVTWIDGAGSDAAIVARRVASDGTAEPMITVAHSSTARGAGFPRAAFVDNGVFVAWTELQPSKRIRVARLEL